MGKRTISFLSMAALILMTLPSLTFAVTAPLEVLEYTTVPTSVMVGDEDVDVVSHMKFTTAAATDTRLLDTYFEVTGVPATFGDVEINIYVGDATSQTTLIGSDTITSTESGFWASDKLPAGSPFKRPGLDTYYALYPDAYYRIEVAPSAGVTSIPSEWDNKDIGITMTVVVAANDADFGTSPTAGTGTTLGSVAQTFPVGLRVTTFTPEGTTYNAGGTDTFDIQYEVSEKADTLKIDIKSGATVVKTFTATTDLEKTSGIYNWDGKNTGGTLVAAGDYTVQLTATKTGSGGVGQSTVLSEEKTFAVKTFWVKTFDLTLTPTGATAPFDPSESGQNEDLKIDYELTEAADQGKLEIDVLDADGSSVLSNPLTLPTTGTPLQAGSVTWDGKYTKANHININKIVEEGTYTVKLTATKGTTTVTQTDTIVVDYGHADAPQITNLSADPDSFNPSIEDTKISFTTSENAELTVVVYNAGGEVVRTFSAYTNDSFSGGSQSLNWDGKNKDSNGTILPITTGYKVKVIARNAFGVQTATVTVDLNDTDDLPGSNVHIKDVDLNPSSTFEPGKDENDLEIEYEVQDIEDDQGDDDDLEVADVYAVRGSGSSKVEIEIDSDTNVSKGKHEVTWDGTDEDDEYVEPGTWRIEVRTEYDGVKLVAGDTIKIEYDTPTIDDLYLSKDEIDPDQDEFTNVLFRVDMDSEIDIYVLEDGENFDPDETFEDIEEELEIDKDVWYAVSWDGAGYDEGDDIEIVLVAKNKYNTDVYDTETISIDVKEDDVSSNKSNVTNDFMDPAIIERGDDIEFSYKLDEDADMKVTIHDGSTASGSAEVTLLDVENQDSGTHTLSWDGTDSDGSLLSTGVYSWKAVSKDGSTETEKGVFVIGKTDSASSGSSSDSDSDSSSSGSGSTAPNVVVDGSTPDDSNSGSSSGTEDCAGFSDVNENYLYCDAIEWAESVDIFDGYPDGTFKPSQTINRVEVLKVILIAAGIDVETNLSGTFGFIDLIAGSWYMQYVGTAKNLGIFHGDSGKTTARPGDPVNRVEALKFAFEAIRVANGFTASSCALPYPDVITGSWYYNYTCEAKNYGLFDLIGSNFSPDLPASRGEVANMLYQLDQAGLL